MFWTFVIVDIGEYKTQANPAAWNINLGTSKSNSQQSGFSDTDFTDAYQNTQ